MSETLINWPDACVFCGDSNGTIGRTANDHWKQFKCGTEYEVVGEKTAWIQDDDCKIAALMKELAAATKRAEEAERITQGCRDLIATQRTRIAEVEQDLNAGREYMRKAWWEMNAIRARDGAPAGVCHEYWSELVDQLDKLLGDDAKPWMTGASLVERNKLTAAEQENALLRKALEKWRAYDTLGKSLTTIMEARVLTRAALIAQPEGAK